MTSQENTPASTRTRGDRQPTQVFRNSRREAIVILGGWFVAMCWSVPYCYYNGYGRQIDPETLNTTMGIPSWLFGGILMPWIVADLFTTWVCFFYMKDDELGRAGDEEKQDPTAVEAADMKGGAA